MSVTSWEKFQDSRIIRVCNNLQRNNGSHAIYILKSDFENVNKHTPRHNLLLAAEHVIYLLYSIGKFRRAKPTRLGLELEPKLFLSVHYHHYIVQHEHFINRQLFKSPLTTCRFLFAVCGAIVTPEPATQPFLQFQWQGQQQQLPLPIALPSQVPQATLVYHREIPASPKLLGRSSPQAKPRLHWSYGGSHSGAASMRGLRPTHPTAGHTDIWKNTREREIFFFLITKPKVKWKRLPSTSL